MSTTATASPSFNLKAKTVFTASDNQTFDTRKDATIHEIGLHLRRALIENGIHDQTGTVKAICMELVKKFPKYKGYFKAIQNANAMKS
jgi:hypothetical protein